jgi:hypothetical protein
MDASTRESGHDLQCLMSYLCQEKKKAEAAGPSPQEVVNQELAAAERKVRPLNIHAPSSYAAPSHYVCTHSGEGPEIKRVCHD